MRADGDEYQNHGTMYNKQHTSKIIIQVTIYLNHTNMILLYIKDNNKTLTTRWCPRRDGAGDRRWLGQRREGTK